MKAFSELSGAEIAASVSPATRGTLAHALGAGAAQPAGPRGRIKAVAHAIANDPACKGKAALALQMLADDDYAALNGSALVKLIGRSPALGKNDDDAREEMRAVLAETAGYVASAPSPSTPASVAEMWDRAAKANRGEFGES